MYKDDEMTEAEQQKTIYNYVQTLSDSEREESTNIYSRVHTQDQTET